MSDLGLDDTTGIRVGIPVLPGIGMSPPEAAGILVEPISGPPGNDGDPGPPGPIGETAGQVRLTKTAGRNLGGHRVVTTDATGALTYASNLTPEHINAPMWLTTGATSLGDDTDVMIYGYIEEPSWSWVPGPLYLGTNGQMTQEPPEAPFALFLMQVGYATSPTSAFFEHSSSISLNLE